MALEGLSRSFLSRTDQKGFQSSSPVKVPPCLPAHLDSLNPTTTQLSQKAQSEHLADEFQTMGGQICPNIINLLPLIFSGFPSTFISITHPPCQFPLSYHSQTPPHPHTHIPFLLLASVSGAVPVTSLWVMRACLLTLCHSLMSWDSNIFARVFFTLRAVRREAGL